MKEPRSVGRMQIGQPQHKDGVFFCDFLFTSESKSIGDDEVKSVTLAVQKEFKVLLNRNGFWKPGQEFTEPEFKIHSPGDGVLYIAATVRTPPQGPIILQ